MHPLNAELNSTCHLLALLGVATIVVVSRLRVNSINRCAVIIFYMNWWLWVYSSIKVVVVSSDIYALV